MRILQAYYMLLTYTEYRSKMNNPGMNGREFVKSPSAAADGRRCIVLIHQADRERPGGAEQFVGLASQAEFLYVLGSFSARHQDPVIT